ncbi:MAG: folate-binding protein YgfZ [Chthoniobacterales bacterium]
MTADFRLERGSVFDLSTRAKLVVRGADRLRYLNGQISNDLRKASATLAIHACVLNAKGKMNADVFIRAEAEAFVLDTDPGMGEQLAARLERYVIADNVEIEDVTERFALFHLLGNEAPVLESARCSVAAERFAFPGTDLWLEREQHDAALRELGSRLPLCDEACAETFRIERGVPRWGRELTEEIIPIEANLEAQTVDYEKGCYIGQEVISRIKMSGQTNKRLCGLVSSSQSHLAAGMRLMTPQHAKDVGWITSATISQRLGKQIALGFVKRGFQTPSTRLDTRFPEKTATVKSTLEVVSLPFSA